MELNKANILESLKQVLYPENAKDIVSNGMVENLQVEGKRVSFDLVFKKDTDPFIKSLIKTCRTILENDFGEDNIEIKGNITARSKEPAQNQQGSAPKSGVDKVKNIIAIASGKGGVGKSTVASNLAVVLAQQGYRVGLLDADIFGPSIPKMFGLEDENPKGVVIDGKDYIYPLEKYNIKLLSVGFFIEPDSALVWRGSMATGALKQLINDTDWGELDYLLIDLPPGTSDIHLTLVQTVPVTGAVIVSTPQDVAIADARKGIAMFKTKGVDVPILGLVENMAWFTPEELPDNKYYLFGKEGCKKLAEEKNIPLLGQIPLVQGIREGGDGGEPISVYVNSITGKAFQSLATALVEQIEIRNKNLEPTKVVEIKHK